jgi:hypothetical protein
LDYCSLLFVHKCRGRDRDVGVKGSGLISLNYYVCRHTMCVQSKALLSIVSFGAEEEGLKKEKG